MKTWDKETIKELILNNDTMVQRSLLQLYNQQTENEQNCGDTIYHNGVGFNGPDGHILSDMAIFYIKNGYLSEKQVAFIRKRIIKYAGQLTYLANEWETKGGRKNV